MIRTDREALIYLVDCQLATVSDLAMRKSRRKGDYERHKSIAQTGISFIESQSTGIRADSRIYKVITEFKGDVSEWAKTYES